MIVDIIKVFIL